MTKKNSLHPLFAPQNWGELEALVLQYFQLPRHDPQRKQLGEWIWHGLALSWVTGTADYLQNNQPNGKTDDEMDENSNPQPQNYPKKTALLSTIFKQQLNTTLTGKSLKQKASEPAKLASELKMAYLEEKIDEKRKPVLDAAGKAVGWTVITPIFEDFVNRRNKGSPLSLRDYVRNSINFFLKELRDSLLSGEMRTTALKNDVEQAQRECDALNKTDTCYPAAQEAYAKAKTKLEAHEKSLRDGSFYRESPYLKRVAWAKLHHEVLINVQNLKQTTPTSSDDAWKTLKASVKAFESGNAKALAAGKKQLLEQLETWRTSNGSPSAADIEVAHDHYRSMSRKLERHHAGGLFLGSKETTVTRLHAGGDGEDTIEEEAGAVCSIPQRTPEEELEHQERLNVLYDYIKELTPEKRELLQNALYTQQDEVSQQWLDAFLNSVKK